MASCAERTVAIRYSPVLSAAKMAKVARSEITGGHVERLTDQVGRLADELRLLRDAIDDLREQLQDAVDKRRPLPPPLHITSLPIDPTVPDFHDRVNAAKSQQACADHPQEERRLRGTRQQSLWSGNQ